MLQIISVEQEGKDLDDIRMLFREYELELDENLCFQSFDEEMKDPLKKYGPPAGVIFLAFWNEELAGCVALTPLPQQGFCEMKRLYVRPLYRQFGIGKVLVEKLIQVATEKKYASMRLDTLTKLTAAIRLYEKYGFNAITSYNNNPLNGVIFMEKSLQ